MENIAIYKTRKEAQKIVNWMMGWNKIAIAKRGDGYAIRCNGVKYMCLDGFVR